MQTARNTTIQLGRSFYLISQSVWNSNGTVVNGRIVIKCNCSTVRIGKCLCAVCQIVFGLKQKDASSLFAFNCASVYAMRKAAAKQERLEFNARKGVVGDALIYSQHRIVLEVRIS